MFEVVPVVWLKIKQLVRLLFGNFQMRSWFNTSEEAKHISLCYLKKRKKEWYFFLFFLHWLQHVLLSSLEKKGCRQGRMSENVRVKVSSVHLSVYPTPVHSQQLEEAHASVCLVSRIQSPSLIWQIVTFDKKKQITKTRFLTFL